MYFAYYAIVLLRLGFIVGMIYIYQLICIYDLCVHVCVCVCVCVH